MPYWYRTEPNLAARKPLLLCLHGAGENAGGHEAQTTKHGPWAVGEQVRNDAVREQLGGFFRVAPHLMAGHWSPATLLETIRDVRARHADVSLDQVLVLGISRGGQGALDFAAANLRGLRISGAVVFCPEDIASLNAVVAGGVPVLLFHCAEDNVVPLDQRTDVANQKNSKRPYDALSRTPHFRWVQVHADWTEGASHHNCWTHLIGHPGLYEWFAGLINDATYGNASDRWPDFAWATRPRQ